MKTLLTMLLGLGVLCHGLVCPADTAPPSKPNIILFMADDFGYECVTANGGQSYQTPNLDRLAAAGLRFEHCHVQPLCTPTRVQLMTGRYKLYRDGRFFDLIADPDETTPLEAARQQGEAAAAAKDLHSVLERFRDARPAELDRRFEQSLPGAPAPKPKTKRKA